MKPDTMIALLCSAGLSLMASCRSSSDSQTDESASNDEVEQVEGPRFWDPIPVSVSTKVPDKISDGYWHGEYQRVNEEVANAEGAQVVFFGDSITLKWSRLTAQGKDVWENYFAKYKPINMGNSGDITPVMLYRIQNGNLDFPKGQEPQVAVLLCGTNNYVVKQSDGGKVKWDLGIDTEPNEVADGIRAIAQTFRTKLPSTRVIVVGILPVKNQAKWAKCQQTNHILAECDFPNDEVLFLDLQDKFMGEDGTLKEGLFTDGTHLTAEGYQVFADAILPEIERLIQAGPIKAQ